MANLYFYIDQIIFVLVAYVSAKEEVYATWAYRNYVPAGTTESKLYHKWGAANIFIFIILSAMAFKDSALSFILLAALNGFIYWLLFDIWFALGIKQKWYYLGGEASTDNFLKNKLGMDPGKKKAFLCIGVIAIINGIYLFFK